MEAMQHGNENPVAERCQLRCELISSAFGLIQILKCIELVEPTTLHALTCYFKRFPVLISMFKSFIEPLKFATCHDHPLPMLKMAAIQIS